MPHITHPSTFQQHISSATNTITTQPFIARANGRGDKTRRVGGWNPPPTCLRAIRGICAKSMNTLSHRLSHTAATYQALYNYPEQRLYTAQPVKMQQNLQISTSNVKELLHTARAPKPQPYNLLL